MNEAMNERCQLALTAADKAGAWFADAVVVGGRSTSVKVRLGKVIEVVQSRDQGLGVRVLVRDEGGFRTATTSTSDLGDEAITRLVGEAVAMARRTAPDPFAGPPEEDFAPEPGAPGDLDTWDEEIFRFDPERAVALALATEDAALSRDARFTNSEGGEMSWGFSELLLMDSRGHRNYRRSTSASLWTTPVAEDGAGGKQRDYWWTSGRHLADLEAPEAVGHKAAQRTLRRLGARKPETAEVPVIFEAPIASRLLGSISGAVNGGAVFRDASWLCGKMGDTIAAAEVTLVDNPWIVRGAASRLFDGEGLATRPLRIVERGVLRSWVTDTYSGKKLGVPSTRSAWRGLGSPSPGTSNLWMENGVDSLEALIANTRRGLLVTDTVGGGANIVNGDFSQGVVGLWIEDGQIAYPVEEITIASTLGPMWLGVDGIADDRHPGRATSAPSFRVAKMTVAGR